MGLEEKLPLINKKSKKVKKYYERQSELLAAYERDDIAIESGKVEHGDKETKSDQLLSQIVLLVNVCLLIAKGVATYLTSGSSLSIISTLLDSVVDITSGLAIWYSTYAIMHTDFFKYPRGRENLEAMSVIFIGIVMGMANFFIIFQSASVIIFNGEPPDITFASMMIIGGTIVTKALLWIICVRKGTNNSLVLAIDQRNDVFTNFVAIFGAISSQYWFSEADPIAAMLISGYVALSWIKVILEQMPDLTGVACTNEQFSRVARVLLNHSNKIRCLDSLLIYHTGHKVRVEAHTVLDPDMQSKEVHDEIVEPLKHKLEKLDFVDKAFVHPDYECDGYD